MSAQFYALYNETLNKYYNVDTYKGYDGDIEIHLEPSDVPWLSRSSDLLQGYIRMAKGEDAVDGNGQPIVEWCEMDRPGLGDLREHVKRGDIVYVDVFVESFYHLKGE